MSAFTVPAGHIDVIVNAAAEFGALPETGFGPRELGQLLWDENYRSVNYRYGDAEPAPRYGLTTTEAPLSPVAVLKAVDCLDYQSCETPDWEDTPARAALVTIQEAVLAWMPAGSGDDEPIPWAPNHTCPRYQNLAAYDTAPWVCETFEQAAALPVGGAA